MERTRIAIDDGIARITLDDGKVNAMSIEMIEEIVARLEEARAADAVSLITGREGIFSAGFDLKGFRRGPEAARQMVLDGARLIERLLDWPLPVVTACTGHAYPMGAFVMLSADTRFGIAGPYKMGMNEVAIGLTLPRFAIEIARHRLTPPGFARAQSAVLFDPETAAGYGYLDHVVAAEELEGAALAEAERLRDLDRSAFAATKARVNEQALAAVRAAIDTEFG